MSFLDHYAHPHLPNLALIGQVSPVIQIHLLAAVAAFAIGAVQIFGPKGTGMHRILGWTWVIFMVVVAGSSLLHQDHQSRQLQLHPYPVRR